MRTLKPPPQNILAKFLSLSDYESRVYSFLVNEGPSSAIRISTFCNIPRTKVYKILKRLIEMGMIVEIPLEPKQFMALPPNRVLKPTLELQRAVQRNIIALISSLQKRYDETTTSSNATREEVWIFSGNKALDKASNFLSCARRNITIFAHLETFSKFYSLLSETLNGLVKRNINIRLLFPISSNTDQRLYGNLNILFKVKYADISIPTQLILINIDCRQKAICIIDHSEDSTLKPRLLWFAFQGSMLHRLMEKIIFQRPIETHTPPNRKTRSRGIPA